MRISFAIFLFMSACQQLQPSPNEPELVMRAYDVPEGTAADVVAMLRIVLTIEKDKRIGQAATSPDGRQVLLTATKAFHGGMGPWLEQLKNAKPTPPLQSIRIEYWVITGKPSKQAKVTPGLQPLQPALDTLTKQYGEQEFALVDRVSISGRSREKVQNASSKLQVSHFASLQGDIVDADIDLDGWKGADIKLRARLNAQLGKFVVVGDSQPEAGVTQYYILRATTL